MYLLMVRRLIINLNNQPTNKSSRSKGGESASNFTGVYVVLYGGMRNACLHYEPDHLMIKYYRLPTLDIMLFLSSGAFYPAVPVQPVCIRYTNKWDTYTWTWDGPTA